MQPSMGLGFCAKLSNRGEIAKVTLTVLKLELGLICCVKQERRMKKFSVCE